MAEIILLRSFKTATFLRGDDGAEVVAHGGQDVLSGDFRIVMRAFGVEHISESVAFKPTDLRAVVMRESNAWVLTDLQQVTFSYSSTQLLKSSSECPTLAFSRISVAQYKVSSAPDFPALLELGDMSLSFRPNVSANPGTLQYPTGAGWKELQLKRMAHPAAGGTAGFYLRRDDEGSLGAFAAAPASQVDIDHAGAVRIFASGSTILNYRVESEQGGADGCLRLEAARKEALQVGASEAANAVFDGKSGDGRRFTWKALRSLEARGGKFQKADFDDQHFSISTFTATAGAETNRIFGSSGSFDLEIDIPEDSVFDPQKHRAAFLYRAEISTGRETTQDPWERFSGLAIAGVHSTRGRQEVFDVDLAEFSLDQKSGVSTFELAAGGNIDNIGESIVIPKVDSLTGRRRSSVATDGMTVTMERDANGPVVNCLRYRSQEGTLTLIEPVLELPPIGATARSTGTRMASKRSGQDEVFDVVTLELPSDDGDGSELRLDLSSNALRPVGKWVEPFRAIANKFELLEVPGVKIEVKKKGASDGIPRSEEFENQLDIDTEWLGDPKKVAVYSVASLAAAWYAIPEGVSKSLDEFRSDAKDFLDTDDVQVNFDFTKMREEDLRKFVRSRGVDSLQVAYFAESVNDIGDQKMRSFIDSNVRFRQSPDPNHKPIKKLYIPFDVGLSVVLMDHGPETGNTGPKRYPSDIVFDAANDPDVGAVRPTVLFKLGQKGVKKSTGSEEPIATDPSLLGFSEVEWKQLAEEQPLLWPRASKIKGGKPDPTDPRWIGIFMRDMPMQLVAPPKVEQGILDKSRLLRKIYKIINSNMYLRYGWIGPNGAAWLINLFKPKGYDVTPEGWEDHVSFWLTSISLVGAEGKPLGAEAAIELKLLKIADGDGNPLLVRGKFGLDVSSSDPITAFELAIDNTSILKTSAIPGFDEVEIVGMSSDLKTATIKIKLTPSQGLASALPIFEAEEAVTASIVLNFSGDAMSDFQLSLPTDAETNLFGRFPLTIQGVYLQLGDNGNTLLVRGRLGLGLVGLETVGADIVLKQVGGSWDFDVYINEIGLSLEVGDNFKMKGLLSWAPDNVPIDRLRPDGDKPKRYNEPVAADEMSTLGKNRDFWGILMLETGDFLGNLTVLVKVGSQGEKTFWVAAVEADLQIGIGGSASFEDPAIVLAKNADMGAGLRKLLLDPYADNVKGLRPTSGDMEAKRKWLTSWRASTDIGAVAAGSGYLHLADGVAESPKSNDTSADQKYLTALVATDSGLFRLDAQTKLLGTSIIGFGIAVDTVNKRLMASVRLPEIAVPTKEQPKYVISPGTMALAINYGGAPYFLLSIGWPPLRPGSQIERDWSQSTKIYIAELFPINTFWGGYRAVLDAGAGFVRFGFAIRAGWTWSAELNGANIAKASAELGITLGGVLEFAVYWKEPQFRTSNVRSEQTKLITPPSSIAVASHPAKTSLTFTGIDQALADQLDESLAVMERSVALGIKDVIMEASVYGDIWGKGSVEFLGVTLASIDIALRLRVQMCGTLKRGITRAWGRGEIEVTVTILCVTYKGRAGFDLWLKRGPHPCLPPINSAIRAPQPAVDFVDLIPQEMNQ